MPFITRLILFLFLIISCHEIFAQSKQKENILLTRDFSDSMYTQKRQVTFGISKSENKIIKYNPVSLLFSGLMFTYQKWISPQVSANCLYSPSCSEYSKLLFQQYGIFKGMFTSADRLMRCDRISATTINPISINSKDGKLHEDVFRYVSRHK